MNSSCGLHDINVNVQPERRMTDRTKQHWIISSFVTYSAPQSGAVFSIPLHTHSYGQLFSSVLLEQGFSADMFSLLPILNLSFSVATHGLIQSSSLSSPSSSSNILLIYGPSRW